MKRDIVKCRLDSGQLLTIKSLPMVPKYFQSQKSATYLLFEQAQILRKILSKDCFTNGDNLLPSRARGGHLCSEIEPTALPQKTMASFVSGEFLNSLCNKTLCM